ncbi:MAG: tetratricopeptide repeat protein [Burkholderiaceae bacterium]
MLLAQEPWYLSTADRGRRRLFPRGIVALFALVMVLVGWLALPSKALHERLANAHESDSLTVAYLHAWLNAAPENWQLRMTLARHEVLLRHDRSALRTIGLIQAQGPSHLHKTAEHLRLTVLERMAFEAPEGAPRRAELLAEVADSISRLARTSDDPITLEAYYHRALSIRAPWLASQVLTRLTALGVDVGRFDRANDPDRVEEYARAAIGLGDFALAARLTWRAFDASTDQGQRMRFLRNVARSEQSGARLPEFFVELEPRLATLELGVEEYKWLARLALAANRGDIAQRFARKMLKFSGGLSAFVIASVERALHVAWHGLGSIAEALSPVSAAHAGMLYEPPTNNGSAGAWANPVPTTPASTATPAARVEPARTHRGMTAAVAAPGSRSMAPAADASPPSSQATAARGRRDDARRSHTNDEHGDDPLAPLLQRLGEWHDRGEDPLPRLAGAPSGPVHATVQATPLRPYAVDSRPLAEAPAMAADPRAPAARTDLATADAATAAPDEARIDGAGDQARPLLAEGELGGEPASRPAHERTTVTALLADLNRDAAQAASARRETRRPARDRSGSPTLAFDDEAYRLAFQIFVANGNLGDAYAVATSATEQVPESWVWHIRAAEVAEWSQRPIEALSTWHRLARATGEARFWNHVERLASGLRDLGKLNDFLSWRLAHAPGDLRALVRLAENYEAQGRAGESVALLRKRLADSKRGDEDFRLRTALADVADRTGDTELLMQTLRELDVRYGPAPARAARQARVLETAGRLSEAFDALVAALGVARLDGRHTAEDERKSHYWQTLARLAQNLQRSALALECYVRMLALDTYEAIHVRDLAELLRPTMPARAAEVLAHGFHRYHDMGLATLAVGSWLEASRPEQAEQFLATMPAKVRERITGSAEYLKQRAAYYQSADKLDEALADLIQVYRLAPDDMDNRAGMLWTLLAQRDHRRLRATIEQWRGEARAQPALWGPFGAALLALDEPGEALPYFVWQARESNDYLWWLAYADALDQAGRADAAWQLRRRAWTELRSRPEPQRPIDPMIRTRVVALAMRFSPADEARRLLHTLVREVAGMTETAGEAGGREAPVFVRTTAGIAPGSPEDAGRLADELRGEVARIETLPLRVDDLIGPRNPAELHALRVAASELAVSYLITQEGNDAARGWLLSRYANDLARPAWAELAMALTNRDDAALDHLLDTVADWLPKLDRIEAERRLGRYASAQTLAFDTAEARPDSDTAHARLVEAVLTGAPSAGMSVSTDNQGALDRTIVHADTSMRLNQHLKLYGRASRTRQSSADPQLLGEVPASVREVGLGLLWQGPRSETRVELAQRDSLRRRTSARASVRRALGTTVELDAMIASAEGATASARLAALGERDRVKVGAHWNLTTRNYVRSDLEAGRWRTASGTRLGDYGRASLELGHRLRIEYPDLTIRTVLSHLQVDGTNAFDTAVERSAAASASDPLAGLLPDSGAQLSIFLTAGATASDGYTRALRPFAELGAHASEISGASISARAGVNTSVIGADQLTLFAAYSQDATGAGRGSRELGLAYRLYF